eukprot:2739658-Alexandrium_andersonii.AAC.1
MGLHHRFGAAPCSVREHNGESPLRPALGRGGVVGPARVAPSREQHGGLRGRVLLARGIPPCWPRHHRAPRREPDDLPRRGRAARRPAGSAG